MKALSRTLAGYFKPARAKSAADLQRSAREKAKKLASTLHVEVERVRGAQGMNIWPTATVEEDPFEGDHYAEDWHDALERLQACARFPSLVKR